jgi:hypothetical protein
MANQVSASFFPNRRIRLEPQPKHLPGPALYAPALPAERTRLPLASQGEKLGRELCKAQLGVGCGKWPGRVDRNEQTTPGYQLLDAALGTPDQAGKKLA